MWCEDDAKEELRKSKSQQEIALPPHQPLSDIINDIFDVCGHLRSGPSRMRGHPAVFNSSK